MVVALGGLNSLYNTCPTEADLGLVEGVPIGKDSAGEVAVEVVIIEFLLMHYGQDANLSCLPVVPINDAVDCRRGIQYSKAPQVP